MLTRGVKRLHSYLDSDINDDTQSVTDSQIPDQISEELQPNKTMALPGKKAKKIPKILDGKYFDVESIDTAGKLKAKCMTCNEIKSGKITSTGNYLKHYETRHELKFQELKIYTKSKDENTKNQLQQPKLGQMLTAIRPEDISPYIIDFTIDGNLSFNVALLPSLRKLLEVVSGRKMLMPTRYYLMKTLDRQFMAMKNTLKECLSKQKYLCATADGWTSRAQSYLGVTIHFINNQSFKRESYLIGFKQMQQRQTYNELARAINEIFLDYGITIEQLRNIVTDGGSNFCKMFKIYGQVLNESTYVNDNDEPDENGTNHTSTDAAITEPHTDSVFMRDATGELFAAEIFDFDAKNANSNDKPLNSSEQNLDEYFGYTDAAEYTETANSLINTETIILPPQKRCQAHKYNLTAHDFRKNLVGLAKSSLNKTLEKLNTLWVLTHKSSQAKTICLEILGRCLPVPSDTRWNSEYDAVAFCNRPEIKPKLNVLIQKLKDTLTCQSAKNLQILAGFDFTLIIEYLKIMEPMACALDVMQKEYNSSQGYVLPVLFSMKRRIEQIEDNSNITRDFKRAMPQAIESRFNQNFAINSTNKDFILASITLPRIKTSFIENDEDIIFAKSILVAECKKLKELFIEEPFSETRQEGDDFLISFAQQRNHRRTSIDNIIESEVSRYLCDLRKEYETLNEFPHIREIFFMYNTTLSSSAPVERVFSQSLMIFTPRRNKISADHFEKTMLLKHNRKLLQENDVNIVDTFAQPVPMASSKIVE